MTARFRVVERWGRPQGWRGRKRHMRLAALIALVAILSVGPEANLARAGGSGQLGPAAARSFSDYLRLPHDAGYRAFAVGPGGRHAGVGQSNAHSTTAISRAMAACRARADGPCRLFAVGDITLHAVDARRRDIALILYQVRPRATNVELDSLARGAADRGLRKEVFHTGAILGNRAAVASMLDSGLPVDTRSPAGVTALLYAASRGRAGIVRLLLARGADVNARNAIGKTALSMALHAEVFVSPRDYRTAEHRDVVRLLRAAGGVE